MADDQNLIIRITTTADTTGAKQTEQALGGVSQAAGKVSEGVKGVSTTTRDAGRAIGDLGRVGKEAQQALGNLERGGLGGLVGAFKNVGNIVRTLATSAFGAVLLPVLATAGVAFALLSKAANDAQASLAKDFAEMTKNSELRKEAITAANKAVADSYKLEVAAMEAVIEGMARLDQQMAASAKRTAELTAAKRELIKATLEAQGMSSAAVDAGFASADAQNLGIQGENQVILADENVRKLDATKNAAFLKTQKIQSEAENLAAEAKIYGTSTSPEAEAARRKALAARSAADVAGKEYEKLQQTLAPQYEKETQRMAEGRNMQEISKLKVQTVSQQTAGSVAKTTASTSGREAELRKIATESQAAGNFAAQDQAVAELRRMAAAADKLAKAVVTNGTTTADTLASTAKALDKQTQIVRNSRESGGK